MRTFMAILSIVLMISLTSCDKAEKIGNEEIQSENPLELMEQSQQEEDKIESKQAPVAEEDDELKPDPTTLKGRLAELFKSNYLGIAEEFGEPDNTVVIDEMEYAVYKNMGVLIGYVSQEENVVVIKPFRYAFKGLIGISRDASITEVEEELGEGNLFVDYNEGDGRFALQYIVDGCNVRIVFSGGKIADVLITQGGVSALEEAADDTEEVEKYEAQSEEAFIKMLNHDMDYITNSLGDFQGSAMSEDSFKDMYSYNFGEEEIIFSGKLHQNKITQVTFYNREVFGVKRGMTYAEINERLGEPLQSKDMQDGTFKVTYMREFEEKELFVDVYLTSDEKSVYYVTVRDNISDGDVANLF